MRNPHIRHCLAAFLLDGALISGATILPFFVYHFLGGTERMSGVIAAFHSGCYACVSLVSANHVHRARNGLVWAYIGTACYAVLFTLSPVFKSPVPFALVSMAGFGCLALVWPAMWSWLGAEPNPELRSRRMARYNVS